MYPIILYMRFSRAARPTSSVGQDFRKDQEAISCVRFREMSIHLEHRDAEANCFRYYHLDIQSTLFGSWSLVRQWGRIGTWGRQATSLFETWDEAEEAQARIVNSKRRRGYVEDLA